MSNLKQVLDYSKAPLVQWEPVVGEKPSEGKQQEDAIIYPSIAAELNRVGAKTVTGIIADEARMEVFLTQKVPTLRKATHLTLTGAFRKAADKNAEKSANVHVTTEIDDISAHSQDAVVMNMILGCVAEPGYYENVSNLLSLSGNLLKKDGKLIIVRPNPDGGKFSTYKCLTPANKLVSGQSYDFIVNGLEEYGAMKNLYTPESFIKEFVAKANFEVKETQPLVQEGANKAPFLLNVCHYKG